MRNVVPLRLMKRCATCKTPLRGKRADAKTCSPACRQALYRSATTVPHDALAELWRDLYTRFGGYDRGGELVTVPKMRRILEDTFGRRALAREARQRGIQVADVLSERRPEHKRFRVYDDADPPKGSPPTPG
jgi:hypothetical protein